MSHWNYRVIRKHYEGGTLLEIHEAYCDENNLVWGVTVDAARPLVVEGDGESVADIKEVLRWMLKACDKPILDYDAIPEPGAKVPVSLGGSDECLEELEELDN